MESREHIAGAPALDVDLDGTLVKTDLLLESIIALLKRGPWCLFILPFWLMKGLAYFKRQIGGSHTAQADPT
jgi:hypothetical protein